MNKRLFHPVRAWHISLGIVFTLAACNSDFSLKSNTQDYFPSNKPPIVSVSSDLSSSWTFFWDDGLFGAQHGSFAKINGYAVAYTPASCDLLGGGDHPVTITAQAQNSGRSKTTLAAYLTLRVHCPPVKKDVSAKILAINDFHGQLSSGKKVNNKPAGSAAVLAAYLNSARQGRENNTILVEAGDLVGGSPANSALLQDEPTVSFFNYFANSYCQNMPPVEQQSLGKNRFDILFHPRCNLVGVPGNHELDEGVPELMRLLAGGDHAQGPFLDRPWRGAKFPVVAANVWDTQQELLFRPYEIKVIDGVQIAFVGALPRDTPSSVMASSIQGLTFADEANSINAQVKELKARNIHAIVAVIHNGGTDQAPYDGKTAIDKTGELSQDIIDLVSKLDEEVDVAITAHSHSFTNAYLKNAGGKDVLVTQAYKAGTGFANIDLTISKDTLDVTEKSAEILIAYATEAITPDQKMDALTLSSEEKVKPITSQEICQSNKIIVKKQNEAGESPLGNLIAEAHRVSMGANIGMTNPGGIRADLPTKCDTEPCTITWNDCFTVQPFFNWIMLVELTGQQLYNLLEQQWNGDQTIILQISGFQYAWTETPTDGKHIVDGSVKLTNGITVDKTQTYTIAANNFLVGGGDGFSVFKEAKVLKEGPGDLDAFIEYLKKQGESGPVKSSIDGRIQK